MPRFDTLMSDIVRCFYFILMYPCRISVCYYVSMECILECVGRGRALAKLAIHPTRAGSDVNNFN